MDKLDGKSKQHTLRETRWFSRLEPFKAACLAIVSALEYLQTKSDTKSGDHLSAILLFDFILPVICYRLCVNVRP